jgi:hypothetical protein
MMASIGTEMIQWNSFIEEVKCKKKELVAYQHRIWLIYKECGLHQDPT